ncbi:hypothetical protein HW115_06285 [Verrucomicrobiaceae bacterium N1E253]|uniref:Uncharacterized protein n=1 Tax=Oceaniferula marina TaxID=2748318 RepID=A0A851GKG0_9BACT|nr:hypothetical protein [Oceaniferula marina]NWK55210.1 hypothetical protein [Oceaniferula marina]
MKTLPIHLLAIFCSLNLLANAEMSDSNPGKLTEKDTWLKLSVVSQNAGHKIHMLGVDNGDDEQPDAFVQEIREIDSLLDDLVAKGVLKKQTFKLKPLLDLEESLFMAVGGFIDKASKTYGYYVVREMMDVGARQRLKEFDDEAPITLNMRMPEPLLKELEALLLKKRATPQKSSK